MSQEAAMRLNALTEELNDILDQAIDALIKLNLGAPASVDLDEGRKLSFRKDAKNGWGLFVDHIPILSASRETRIKSVDKLDELLGTNPGRT